METAVPDHLVPRKRPRQARALATLDAIFEATLQVLVAEGPQRLTTTRVAHRAGVSVGTMYQYFPHKQALIHALNERYLETLAVEIERTCLNQQGTSVETMVEALIDTYWRLKMERPEVTRALYRSVVEIDNTALIEAFASRVDTATTAMLASARDATFEDIEAVNLTLVTVIFGTVRNAFERGLCPPAADALQRQLSAMCRAYVRSAADASAATSRHRWQSGPEQV